MSKKRFHTLQLPRQPLGSEGSLYHGEKPEPRRLSQDLKSPKHNLNLRDSDKIQLDPTSMSILRILSQICHYMNIYLETFRVAQICCPVVIQPWLD